MDAGEITSTDVEELYAHFGPIIEKVRSSSRPHFEVIHTYRLCHHSKSDDKRPVDEVDAHRAGDPLPLQRARLEDAEANSIDREVNQRIEAVVKWARQQPFPDGAALTDLLSGGGKG